MTQVFYLLIAQMGARPDVIILVASPEVASEKARDLGSRQESFGGPILYPIHLSRVETKMIQLKANI